MKRRIGKYILNEDETKLSITYKYTVSDFFGSIWFLLMLLMGLFMLLLYYKTFSKESLYSFGNWVLGLAGLYFSLFGAYLLVAGFYNLWTEVFKVDKLKQEITIFDFLKSETISFINISSIYHRIETSHKPRTRYSMLCLRLTNGETKECFIIRSSIPIDIGRKVDKDLNIISRQIRDAINNVIRIQKENYYL